MAPRLLKTVTLILALTTFVGTLTLSVHVPTAIAATGSSGSTNGDPDSPKDSSPTRNSAGSQVITAPVVSSTRVGANALARWIMVQEIMRALLGRPI